jgi:hypothetical protein
MGAENQRTYKRSVIGSVVGCLVLTLIVVTALELVALAFAGPHSSPHIADLTMEQHFERGGSALGYPIQY